MNTKEEIKKELLDLEGFDFDAFEYENEYSAKAILKAMDIYAAQEVERAKGETCNGKCEGICNSRDDLHIYVNGGGLNVEYNPNSYDTPFTKVINIKYCPFYGKKIESMKTEIADKKLEILNWIFKSKDGASWNEVSEMLNEFEKVCNDEAIAEHEAAQWKKYPEEKPEHKGEYLVEVKTIRGNQFELLEYNQGWLGRPTEMIIAFRELPKPYQEGGER